MSEDCRKDVTSEDEETEITLVRGRVGGRPSSGEVKSNGTGGERLGLEGSENEVGTPKGSSDPNPTSTADVC